MHEGPLNNEEIIEDGMANVSIEDMCKKAEEGLGELPTEDEGTIDEIAAKTGLTTKEIEELLEKKAGS